MDPRDHDNDDLYPERHERQRRSTAPRTIGILNIVFGSLMLLCVICSAVNVMAQSALGPMMGMQQQQLQQAMQAQRQQQLQQLQAREQAANDEQEKAQLKAQQAALQAQPVPKMPDFGKFAQDPEFQSYSIVEAATGLILNLLMIVSGIGLLGYKEWGRVMAIWVAALKILRLIVLQTFFILVIVPIVANHFTTMFEEMAGAMPPPPGQKAPAAAPAQLKQMGTFMGVMMTAGAVVTVLFGVIYPIIVLIVLTRKSARAACAPAAPATA